VGRYEDVTGVPGSLHERSICGKGKGGGLLRWSIRVGNMTKRWREPLKLRQYFTAAELLDRGFELEKDWDLKLRGGL